MDENKTLVIEDVDFGLLEKQRLELVKVVSGVPFDMELIDGLLNMLDSWSDSEYYKKMNA